jgi:two-component system response regulator AtoC
MIGNSKVMQDLFQLADKVARHTTTVLITGESGTGKELVARGIHDKSPRAAKPFVAVNCGSVPENLLESEFFGYVKGAFTGADRNKKGLFEEAEGSTLFLDEIGELPLAMQVKLLRVLQEHEIRRIGAAKSMKIDVRIVAATAKDLAEEVDAGRFREDLYYRLNVIHVRIPPLRERAVDIPLLCDFFLEKFAVRMGTEHFKSISPAVMKLLMNHPWPGNVRELENVIERAIILADKNVILPENLPENIGGRKHDRRLNDILGTLSIKEGRRILEHRLISRAMESTGGNKSRAAELLEISYPSLLSKIKEYGI